MTANLTTDYTDFAEILRDTSPQIASYELTGHLDGKVIAVASSPILTSNFYLGETKLEIYRLKLFVKFIFYISESFDITVKKIRLKWIPIILQILHL